MFENKHLGETCIIIGNGPSLNDIPLDLLNAYPTFGTNKIWKLKGFTPTYYASVNPEPIKQSIKQINKMKCEAKFIRHTLADQIDGAFPLRSGGFWTFSKDPANYVFEGYTVTYVCMQLAYWMGFQTVLLVGVDHYFDVKGAPNELQVADGKDPNHFDPTYFADGDTWNLPDLDNSERAYNIAKRVFEKSGRRIINLTTKTALDVFPRDDYCNWLPGPEQEDEPCQE